MTRETDHIAAESDLIVRLNQRSIVPALQRRKGTHQTRAAQIPADRGRQNSEVTRLQRHRWTRTTREVHCLILAQNSLEKSSCPALAGERKGSNTLRCGSLLILL